MLSITTLPQVTLPLALPLKTFFVGSGHVEMSYILANFA